MKANRLMWLILFMMLGVAAAQQSSSRGTNSAATNKPRPLTDAEVGLVTDTTNHPSTNVDFVPDNPIEVLKAMAEKSDATAQFNLGLCYYSGQGVAKDEVKAVDWFRKAADQNNVDAQCFLAFCYAFGQGVATNYVEAVKWSRKAAEQNNTQAQYYLGQFYLFGKGVTKDEGKR